MYIILFTCTHSYYALAHIQNYTDIYIYIVIIVVISVVMRVMS